MRISDELMCVRRLIVTLDGIKLAGKIRLINIFPNVNSFVYRFLKIKFTNSGRINRVSKQ